MNRINKFTNWLMGIYHKFPNTKYPVKYAFTVGGIDYYQFDDIFNLPYERALKCLTAYEEIRMKCTYEYLTWHAKAMDNLIRGLNTKNSTIVNLAEMSKLNNNLRQRLEQWVIDLRHAERLASIVFFDKNENPAKYDFKYANEKIAHWRKHNTMDVFFSHVAIQTLIPFLKNADMNFQVYSEVIKQFEAIHLKDISLNLSEEQRKDFINSQSGSFATETSQN